MRTILLMASFSWPLLAVEPAPVVVELYTSDGCSSCPAAERVLRELSAADTTLLVIAWHVTYWDYLGWQDRWGIADTEVRQRRFAALTHSGVFTPQAIVQGRTSCVGSDRSGVVQAIANARANDPARLCVPDVAAVDNGCRITCSGFPASTPVMVMVVQDHLTAAVAAGENRGSNLRHDGVVRWWRQLTAGETVHAPLPADSTPAELRIVAFSSTDTGMVTAAGQVAWPMPLP